MTEYRPISPPFLPEHEQFCARSKSELKKYFVWFLTILPQRIGELRTAVTRASEYADWEADFSPASLDRLGLWFASRIETRIRSDRELREIEKKQTIRVFDQDFRMGPIFLREPTPETLSLATDVGMYLSQVLLRAYPALEWHQGFGSKRNVDYGQPVLGAFGLEYLNPVGIGTGLAYRWCGETKDPERLRGIYEYWEARGKRFGTGAQAGEM